jgi:hypothetical protein
MLKPVYGLKDAPRAWRIKLDMTLRELGGRPLHSDGALYVWFKGKELSDLLSTHVDDLKGGGDSTEQARIKAGLEKRFGAVKELRGSFEHCGIMHEQGNDCVVLHQNHYVKQVHLLDMVGVSEADNNKALTTKQTASFLTVLGGLSWLIQTRMDIAVYVCALQRVSKAPLVVHYIRLNRLVKWVKRKPTGLTFHKLRTPLKVIAISDSAFRKEDSSGLAMRGAIIAIAEASSNQTPGGKLHVIDFYSRKQRRVTRSTFAAELQALADAVEMARLFAMALAECVVPQITSRQIIELEESGQLPLPIEAVVDAKGVFDALASTEIRSPTESSLVMVLLQLKELLCSFTLRRLWWCDTRDMLSDGLNKGAVPRTALLQSSATGLWQLSHPALCHLEKVQRRVESRASLSNE